MAGTRPQAPLYKLQHAETKGVATQDNETTSGSKAGTKSHTNPPTVSLEDNELDNVVQDAQRSAKALSRTKLFNNSEGNSEYICTILSMNRGV